MKSTLDVQVEYTFQFDYDTDSDLYKQTIKDYNEVIDKGANHYDMLKQIAWHVSKFGVERMIEGVGFISVDGTPQGDPYCGINLKSGYDEADVW